MSEIDAMRYWNGKAMDEPLYYYGNKELLFEEQSLFAPGGRGGQGAVVSRYSAVFLYRGCLITWDF